MLKRVLVTFGSGRGGGLRPVPRRLFAHDFLERLHIPVSEVDFQKMLDTIQVPDERQLISRVLGRSLMNPVEQISSRVELPLLKMKLDNRLRVSGRTVSFGGQGFYNTNVPAVVERAVLTNPMWYTAYTPYQAEISQGRLEALFNYQAMVKRITHMEMANACLLDEASAGAEAVLMAFRAHNFKRKTVIVADSVFANTKAVIESTIREINVNVIQAPLEMIPQLVDKHRDDLVSVVLQTPDAKGFVHDFEQLIGNIQLTGALAIVGTDLLACMMCRTPGEMGADVVFGNGQRFGTPMGFGGPHAAFFACKMTHLRRMPGRIISVARDAHNNLAYRLAVQTREQHIRREIATSNICTSQVLLANLNYFYSLYHGEDGLRDMAAQIHAQTVRTAFNLKDNGVDVVQLRSDGPVRFFDTFTIRVPDAELFAAALAKRHVFVYKQDANHVSVSFDEINQYLARTKLEQSIFRTLEVDRPKRRSEDPPLLASNLRRADGPIFKPADPISRITGEHELLRYIYSLARKDITLCDSMIPLGSCTMKLNPAFAMQAYGAPSLQPHPYLKGRAIKAYKTMLPELSRILCALTGMDGVTYQSNSGATGEYVGLKTIKRYHQKQGQGHRDVVLIPASAHGTNPASAAKIGLKVVVVAVASDGYIQQEDFQQKLNENRDKLFCLMLTFPSTHGVFEESTNAIINMVHTAGGQVYIDGANMNAQLGLTSPGAIGGDVCHLNLHKTFAIPHGGGGPGMGPVLCKAHLLTHLPSHLEEPMCAFDSQGRAFAPNGGQTLSSPFGSASILMISFAYALGLGTRGVRRCGVQAIASANYLAKRLAPHYKILYTNLKGLVAHEFILDIRPLKAETGISEEDIAKRLMDYNFHAPTMSFPVPGTLMVEPTESESLAELDRFADALILIRDEIRMVGDGRLDRTDNPLKNAPHTLAHVTSDTWSHPYSRELAGWPAPWLRQRGKVWPGAGRINGAAAERNLAFELPDPALNAAAN